MRPPSGDGGYPSCQVALCTESAIEQSRSPGYNAVGQMKHAFGHWPPMLGDVGAPACSIFGIMAVTSDMPDVVKWLPGFDARPSQATRNHILNSDT